MLKETFFVQRDDDTWIQNYTKSSFFAAKEKPESDGVTSNVALDIRDTVAPFQPPLSALFTLTQNRVNVDTAHTQGTKTSRGLSYAHYCLLREKREG